MMRALVIVFLLTFILGQASWNDPRVFAYRDAINGNPASTWKAEVYLRIPYGEPEKLRAMLGVKVVSSGS